MPATLISAVFAALAMQGSALEPANFSGVWALDRSRSESAVQETSPREVAETITQTAADIGIVTVRDGRSDEASYPIVAPPGAEDTMAAGRRAFWQGASLVNEGSVDIEGQTVSFRQSRTLAPGGAEMFVETTLKLQHGYTMQGVQTVVSGKDVYVRRP